MSVSGLEPKTISLKGYCSNQLSYTPLNFFPRTEIFKYKNYKIKILEKYCSRNQKINRMVMIARDKRMDCSNHISLPLTQKYLNMKITKLKFWKNLVELLRSFYDEVVNGEII